MVDNLDLMATSREFKIKNALDESIRFRAKKVSGTSYDIWLQDNTKKIRDTLALVLETLGGFSNLPRIVILKEQKLKGIAGYSRFDNTLYISDCLNSLENINSILANKYFAAENLVDILTHELAHKRHWDNAKRLYNKNKKRYNNIDKAKLFLDSELVTYVKRQVALDRKYLNNISLNAKVAYANGNINELVAEVAVLGDRVEDKNLLRIVKGVLRWK